MWGIFDKNWIALTLFDQGISWLELAGVLTALVSVVLAARERKATWIWGLGNGLLFFMLFFQSQLYSDAFLQWFYVGTSIYGIWRWTHPRTPQETWEPHRLKMRQVSWRERGLWLLGIGLGTWLLGTFMGRIHELLPHFFPQPAAFPYPDAGVTLASIAAQILLTRKRWEAWILWILVDVLSTYLFFSRGLILVGLEYLVFTFVAVGGLVNWQRIWRTEGRA